MNPRCAILAGLLALVISAGPATAGVFVGFKFDLCELAQVFKPRTQKVYVERFNTHTGTTAAEGIPDAPTVEGAEVEEPLSRPASAVEWAKENPGKTFTIGSILAGLATLGITEATDSSGGSRPVQNFNGPVIVVNGSENITNGSGSNSTQATGTSNQDND